MAPGSRHQLSLHPQLPESTLHQRCECEYPHPAESTIFCSQGEAVGMQFVLQSESQQSKSSTAI